MTHSFQALGVVCLLLDAMDGVDGIEAAHKDKQHTDICEVTQTLLREGQHNLQASLDLFSIPNVFKNPTLIFCVVKCLTCVWLVTMERLPISTSV